MLNPRQFVDFLALMNDGVNSNKTVYDGNGNAIDSQRLVTVLDDIVEVRSPWRAEWLDAKFKNVKKVLLKKETYIAYDHRTINGGLQSQYEELLQGHLMKDKTPGIELSDWLNKATVQGLPPVKCKKGDLYYWYPRYGVVAGFGAGSVRAYLDCGGFPSYSNDSLGVRAVRRA